MYVCKELINNQCTTWVVYNSPLDSLAITGEQAVQIAVAMCSVMLTGWILGEIGHMIKASFFSRF